MLSATLMLGAVAVPSCVKVAVQVNPPSAVLKPANVPPAKVTSDASKPVTASLKVKVTVVLSPRPRFRSVAVIASVGAVASTVTVPVTGAETLPATSVAVTLTVCGPSVNAGSVLSASVQVPSPLLVAG